MKILLRLKISFLAVLIIPYIAFANELQISQMHQAIGSVIEMADREKVLEFGYGFPNLKTSKKIDAVYEKTISKLDIQYRAQFFWSMMYNLDLGSHYSEELVLMIHQDCSDYMLNKIAAYKQKVNDVGSDIWIKNTSDYKRILLYEHTLKHLKEIKY